jgi:general secretion pathway protein G
MGVLASIVVPVAQVEVQRTREQELRRALHEIRHAIDAYKRADDEGHITKAVSDTGYPKNLNMLVDGVPDQRDPLHKKIYFLRRLPRDPMNPDMTVSEADSWGLRSYASEPDDPQPGKDVYDIYSTSGKTGLNGVPYRKW